MRKTILILQKCTTFKQLKKKLKTDKQKAGLIFII